MPETRVISDVSSVRLLHDSLSELFTEPHQDHVEATAALARLLKATYVQGRVETPYAYIELTTKQLLASQIGLVGLLAVPAELADRGLTTELLQRQDKKLVALRLLDAQLELLYVLPRSEPSWMCIVPGPVQTLHSDELSEERGGLVARYMLRGACHNCDLGVRGEQPALLKCSACRCARYCGLECQRADWPRHRTVCSELEKSFKAAQ